MWESTAFVRYNAQKDRINDGVFRYDTREEHLDQIINDFMQDKKITSVQQSSFVMGNNPSRTILIYTIVYEE